MAIESHQISSAFSKSIEHTNIPTLVSPPDTTGPPLAGAGKHNHLNGGSAPSRERSGSEAVDPNALTKALKEFEEAGRARERTPAASPSRKRQRVYGDRLVTESLPKVETKRGGRPRNLRIQERCENFSEPILRLCLVLYPTMVKIRNFLELLLTFSLLDSYPIEKDKIYKQASAFFTTNCPLVHRPR